MLVGSATQPPFNSLSMIENHLGYKSRTRARFLMQTSAGISCGKRSCTGGATTHERDKTHTHTLLEYS